jgi:hypothetical protein
MASYILYVFEAYLAFLCCPFAYTRKSRLMSSEVENYQNAIQPCKCKRADYPIIDCLFGRLVQLWSSLFN